MATYTSFPHPVMGNRDNVNESLELLQPQYKPTASDVYIELPIRCTSDQLKNLVKDGEAQISVTWDCGATMSRGIAKTTVVATNYGWNCSLYLVQEEISGTVSIDVEIIAKRQLLNFRWDAQHPIYRGSTFDISEGDVLGILGGFEFEARKLYDVMDPPLGSLFVVHATQSRDLITVDYDIEDDQILIQLSPEMAQHVGRLGSGSYDATKISSLIFPVLVDTLNLMSRALEDPDQDHYQEKQWFKALEARVKDLNLDIHNAVPTAQELLGNISAKAMLEIIDEDGDQG